MNILGMGDNKRNTDETHANRGLSLEEMAEDAGQVLSEFLSSKYGAGVLLTLQMWTISRRK